MAASKRKAFRPPWMLLVLVALVGIINTARAETFTAVTHFRSLLNLEQDLSDKLQAYIAAEEKQLEKLKQLSSEVRQCRSEVLLETFRNLSMQQIMDELPIISSMVKMLFIFVVSDDTDFMNSC